MLTTSLEIGGIVVKHWLFCLLLAMTLWILPGAARAEVLTPELVRLQVVAQSDSPEDQALKLLVRNGVLDFAQLEFADANNAEEAYIIACRKQSQIEDIARQIVSDSDRNCEVQVDVGEFEFPDRIYGGVLVPAGTYRAVRVTLGEGAGHNWWCVLYPTLCRIDEAALQDDDTLTFYSHTLRFLERLFGGDAA